MIYEYWLAGIKEITDLKKQKLREVYGSGKAIYYIEETKLDKLRFLNEKDVAILKNAKKDTKLEEKWRKTEEKRIQFIPYFLKTYPEKLKYITDPPYALYVLGQLPDEKRKSAAIVGARNCSGHSFTRCPLHTIPTTEFRYHLDFSRYPSPEVRKNTLLFPLLL